MATISRVHHEGIGFSRRSNAQYRSQAQAIKAGCDKRGIWNKSLAKTPCGALASKNIPIY